VNDVSHTKASDFMTLKELQERMGISPTTAYELARKNDLPIPAFRVGRQFRFSRHGYERMCAELHPSSAAE
jgi:excisionase family DNA binding protein